MNRDDRTTRDKKKDENLRFLLDLCKKETGCADCGIFLADSKRNSFQPLLTQKRSKDLGPKIKAYWEKEDLFEQSPEPILIGKGETIFLAPFFIDKSLFGFFAAYFPISAGSLGDDKYQKLVLISQQIGCHLENQRLKESSGSEMQTLSMWQEELFQMRKMASVGELTRDFAHDINNPLQVILGKAQILTMRMGKEPQNEKYVEELKSIEKNAQRISCLLSKLSNFARRSEKNLGSSSDVNLGHLIEQTFLLVKSKFRSKGIEFKIKSGKRVPSVKGNSHQLEQVFLDLFLNAQKAMPQGGTLTVNVKKERGFLKLDFADTREKMPGELPGGVFDPMSLGPDLKKRLHPGLFLCNDIIRDHKGKMEILSHKDKGNTFRLKLPIMS